MLLAACWNLFITYCFYFCEAFVASDYLVSISFRTMCSPKLKISKGQENVRWPRNPDSREQRRNTLVPASLVPALFLLWCFIVKVSDKESGLAVNREMDTLLHGNW